MCHAYFDENDHVQTAFDDVGVYLGVMVGAFSLCSREYDGFSLVDCLRENFKTLHDDNLQ